MQIEKSRAVFFQAAKKMGWGIDVIKDTLPYLVKMKKGEKTHYTTSFIAPLPPSPNDRILRDKELTSLLLENEGLPMIKTRCIHNANASEQYDTFSKNGTIPVVIKPIDGSKAKDVTLFTEKEKAMNFINQYQGTLCISSYFPHEIEMRAIVYKGKTRFFYHRTLQDHNPLRPEPTNGKWVLSDERTNAMKELAEKVGAATGFKYLSVDFLVSEFGEAIIECNGNPGFHYYLSEDETNEEGLHALMCEMFSDLEEA